ncbi:transcriptional regulator [Nonomuraea sp. NPDC050786]|uniref:transcriptional regulator n=1 Tax=Nonomuraea sp. NPDC050786 TaxID=3154840 RepID=UPI0033F452CE
MIFAVYFAAWFAGHYFADHWVQNHRQAMTKGDPAAAGRSACMRHVLTLTATLAGFGLLAELATGIRPPWYAVLAGLAWNAVTHYWADRAAFHPGKDGRKVTLERIADALRKTDFWNLGKGTVKADGSPAPTLGTGAYALDQSFHVAMVFLAALLVQVLSH